MILTEEQQKAVLEGKAVPITVAGHRCVLLRNEEFQRLQRPDYNDDEWTDEEMDLLAAEDADRLGWEGMDVYQDEP